MVDGYEQAQHTISVQTNIDEQWNMVRQLSLLTGDSMEGGQDSYTRHRGK
jgi:hypothetical protein